ncbi:MAG: hypothetical protein IK068_01025 [Lachnospiraceae bacterium]|nr:hypothetical protein [Lachnospiraceae bacterium]
MKGTLERIAIYIGIVLSLVLIYTGLMTLTFSYKSDAFETRTAVAANVVGAEGEYPTVTYFKGGATLDNSTDLLMVGKIMGEEDENALYQGMSIGGYSRYWHGYLVWLRLLSVFFSLPEIRIILSLLNLSLFIVGLLLIHEKFGFKVSIPFALMWFSCFSMVTLGSLQFSTVSLLLYAGVIFAIKAYNPEKKLLPYAFFLIMGSLVNFFDLLTYPLVTLTVPLVLMCLIDISEERKTKETFLMCIKASVLWCVSYGATWAMKWVLGSIVTHTNVIKNASDTAMYRMLGEEGEAVDRLKVIVDNFKAPLLYEYIPVICVITVLIALILKKGKQVVAITPLLMLSVYPYIWYEVFCEHSLMHTFFTYRTQMGSIFAIATVSIVVLTGIKATKKEEQ